MAKKFPLHPAHPERTCWGCDLYCAADSMRCGNGSERTQHPVELFGDDWVSVGLDAQPQAERTGVQPVRVERTAAAGREAAAPPRAPV